MSPYYFEAIMLICFGAAWPFSIYKMLKTKKAQGKSVIFLVVIITGYLAGIMFEYTGNKSPVIALYILNIAMVAFDLALTLFYRRRALQ